ncbi:hypothetical protein QBC46DRAFT_448143 [Diplogelasinospora grovesii]|uniref:Uncharacterized protein n=1 Tax=Diplogelasinospora grovesii TaxID=303347 RepID=A0AAN6NA83_9PEZI|nr:hypothetical protein QBC46DRAFT_448143 [Diplogelasinospora grovesii]
MNKIANWCWRDALESYPRTCDYSRQLPPTVGPYPEAKYGPIPPSALFASRLDKIEATLETLTIAVNRLVALTEARDGQGRGSQPTPPELSAGTKKPQQPSEHSEATPASRDESKPKEPSHSLSSVHEASAHLNRLLAQHSSLYVAGIRCLATSPEADVLTGFIQPDAPGEELLDDGMNASSFDGMDLDKFISWLPETSRLPHTQLGRGRRSSNVFKA